MIHNYKKENEVMSESKVKWHKYSKEIPPGNGPYLVTIKHNMKNFVRITYPDGRGWNKEVVIAWAELPKPYDKRRTRGVNVKWHPYPEEKPSKLIRDYLVTYIYEKKRDVSIDMWLKSQNKFPVEEIASVMAWAELPEPYKEGD